jgi:hypothetical protein
VEKNHHEIAHTLVAGCHQTKQTKKEKTNLIDLKSISRNVPKPPRVVIYGPIGIGKSTFAAGAKNPVFILPEDGLGDIDALAFPIAKTYEEIMDDLTVLGKDDHDYKTVVIDSLDQMEPLVWAATCKRLGVSSIEEPGYGKGYVETDTEWRKFFEYLTALRDYKNMTVIMIAHNAVVRVEDPVHPAYDMHDIKIHKRAAAIIRECSDIFGFATTKTVVITEKGEGFEKDRNRAIQTDGEHVLYLQGDPAFVAKNRYHMPKMIPLLWSEFEKHLPKQEN